jgi:hypothetical protein
VRQTFLDFDLTMVAVMAGFMFLVASCLAQPQHQPSATQGNSLKKFLQSYVGVPTDENIATRYSATFVDLRDDGTQEIIVYLTSDGWCGTGGCTTLILAPEGTSYRIVTTITVVRLPIRVLATKSNGWHDISVVTRINGIEPTYEAILSFDGKSYPSNPSMPPARRLDGKVEGQIVMPVTAEDKPLYQ